jgi:ribosomal protein S18 acetylase RimI-like enzyme
MMECPIVVNAETDKRGAQKENIFLALDGNGESLGALFIYPFFDEDIEPEHPHNLYLHLQAEQGNVMSEPVKDVLIEKALIRAKEIKKEAGQRKTRIYACFFKHQQEEIDYFLQRGFKHDEGMYIMERHESEEITPVEMPVGVTIQPWKMATDVEKHTFIETHRKIFPRHPYTVARLHELMSLSAWNNFTALSHNEIAGNIMVFSKGVKGKSIGNIEDLFVQKQWRGRGIAKYLLYTALRYFQDIGIHQVQLELWSANTPALNLYRLFGFSQIDETEVALGRYV